MRAASTSESSNSLISLKMIASYWDKHWPVKKFAAEFFHFSLLSQTKYGQSRRNNNNAKKVSGY